MTHASMVSRSEPFYDGAGEFVALLGRLANAQGCALYEARHGTHKLVRSASAGPRQPDLEELEYGDLDHLKLRKQWATLPLHSDGLISAVLILVFDNESEKQAAKPALKRIVPLFESLARFVGEQNRQVKLASKISELETEIAAEKILDRAKGLLREHPYLTEATIELIDRHAAKVLAPSSFSQVLQNRLQELETLATERDITAQAKEVLQQSLGLSEEKAYLHLRTLSRQKRRRIVEIARDIVDGNRGNSPSLHRKQT